MPIQVSGEPTSFLPGLYVQNVATPAPTPKLPGDIVGLVFEASRGPLNKPTWIRDIGLLAPLFGGRQPSVANAAQLLSDYTGYYPMELNQVQDTLGVRVAGATAATAHLTLLSTTNPVVTLHAGAGAGTVSPGTWANGSLAVTVAPGTGSTVNLTVSNSATGEAETLFGLDYTDNAALIAAINKASTLLVASQPVSMGLAAAPTFAATTGSGTVAAGSYRAIVTLVFGTNPDGSDKETQGSPETALVTLAATGKLSVTVANPGSATAWKAYITDGTGASGTETFALKSTTFGAPVDITAPWTASSVTPPVQNTATTGPGFTGAAPTTGTFVFPSTTTSTARAGNNGEGATAAQYVGTSGTPTTGIYAFAGVSATEKPSYVVLAGAASGDPTQWGAQAQAAYDNGWQAVVGFAQGTSNTAALTAWQTFTATLTAAVARHIKVAWPWVKYFDETYAAKVLVPSAPFLAAIGAVTPPNTSAANKPVAGVVELEYTLANRQAADDLANANVNAISGMITSRTAQVGFLSDFMGDGTDAYVTRMVSFIVDELNLAWSDLGSDLPIDEPHMQLVQDTGMNALDAMAAATLIQSNPAGGTATVPVVGAGTSGASGAGTHSSASTAGTQPSTVTAGAATSQAYAVLCAASNNFDANGLPLSNSLIVDVQVRLTKNAYNVWLRLAAGVLQQVTIQPTA